MIVLSALARLLWPACHLSAHMLRMISEGLVAVKLMYTDFIPRGSIIATLSTPCMVPAPRNRNTVAVAAQRGRQSGVAASSAADAQDINANALKARNMTVASFSV